MNHLVREAGICILSTIAKLFHPSTKLDHEPYSDLRELESMLLYSTCQLFTTQCKLGKMHLK